MCILCVLLALFGLLVNLFPRVPPLIPTPQNGPAHTLPFKVKQHTFTFYPVLSLYISGPLLAVVACPIWSLGQPFPLSPSPDTQVTKCLCSFSIQSHEVLLHFHFLLSTFTFILDEQLQLFAQFCPFINLPFPHKQSNIFQFLFNFHFSLA